MFTGLVEELGKVIEIKRKSKGARLTVSCQKIIDGTKLGDSIAVNGVCLTVVKIGNEKLSFDISQETLRRSTLDLIKPGEAVNLERALKLSDRLGGHILQGHVDTITKITAVKREGEGFIFKFKIPPGYSHLLVEKGSIGIDGISLTVASLSSNEFSVAVIPHTYRATNLQFKKAGDRVNLEFDIIGKYVERMLKKK
ncbi:MAG: riboflavin synthase [Desulfurobacteriaceae bacterium]